MSSAEIIDQIKALESQERAKILALLLEIETAEKVGCMNDERFDELADRVLSRHADLMQKLAQCVSLAS
jgi:DNA-binding transcriptional ArsR family regulator